MKSFNATSFLLGAIAVLLAVIAFRLGEAPTPVHADTSIGPNLTAIALTQNNFDYLAVIDSDQKMAVYEVRNNGMKLISVRNIKYDLDLDFYNFKGTKQEPTVQEIKKVLDAGGSSD